MNRNHYPHGGADASALRLCKVALRLASTLFYEYAHDGILQHCTILDTRPGATRNTVVIVVGYPGGADEVAAVFVALTPLRAVLRCELARATQRKRVAMVEFDVVPSGRATAES